MPKLSTAAIPATTTEEVAMSATAAKSAVRRSKSTVKAPAKSTRKAGQAKRVAGAARRQTAIPAEAKTTGKPVKTTTKAAARKAASAVVSPRGHEVSRSALTLAMPALTLDTVEQPTADAVDAPPAIHKSPVEKGKTAVGRLGRPKPTKTEPHGPWDDLVFRPELAERNHGGHLRMVAYLRFSCEMQTVNSLQRQLEVIQAYAAANNMVIVAVHRDEAKSGLKEDREGLESSIKVVEDGHADGVIAEDCDRYARKHSILPSIFERIDAVGGQLWTMTRGRIPDAMMAALYGVIAAEDHKKLVARFTAGVQIAIRDGRIPRLPFGYRRLAKCVWEIHDEQAAIVQLIFRLYIGERVSAHNIAKHLNDEGVASPWGGTWSATQIGDTLKNPIYCGVYLHGRVRPSRRMPKSTIVLRVPELALVSVEEFAFAQAQRRERAPDTRRVHFSYNFLKGRVFCATTGRSYHSKRMNNIFQVAIASAEGQPQGAQLYLATVRGAVIDAIERRILNADGDAAFQSDRQAERARQRKVIARARVSVGLKLKAANAKADEAADEDFLAGASFDRRRRRREELEARVVELQDSLLDLRRRERNLDAAMAFRETLKDRLERLRTEGVKPDGSTSSFELAQALRSVIVAVRLRHDRANGLVDVAVDLAPNGDVDPRKLRGASAQGHDGPPIDIVTDEARIYLRVHRSAGDPFVSRVADALARGWLPIGEDEDRRLCERVEAFKALPRSWGSRLRISLVRGLIACSLTSLPVRVLPAIQPSDRRTRIRGGYDMFVKAGGVKQLGDALAELRFPGVPLRDDGQFLPDCPPGVAMTWRNDWG